MKLATASSVSVSEILEYTLLNRNWFQSCFIHCRRIADDGELDNENSFLRHLPCKNKGGVRADMYRMFPVPCVCLRNLL